MLRRLDALAWTPLASLPLAPDRTALAWIALVPLALAASTGPAFAHAILMDSQPAHDTTIHAGAQTVVLRFNSLIDSARSRLLLVGVLPAGQSGPATTLAIDRSAPENMLQAETTLPVGHWRLRWQVLALDGHITRGDVPFTVAP